MSQGDKQGTVYLAALTVQRDGAPGQVMTSWRMRSFTPTAEMLTVEDVIRVLRQAYNLDEPGFHVISELVCEAMPFKRPTRCKVSVTIMPTYGPGRLRRTVREFEISETFTLFNAFYELVKDEQDSVIGWQYAPIDL